MTHTPDQPGSEAVLLSRAAEVVHHDIDCPAIGGNGDDDCTCDAVSFLRDLAAALTRPGEAGAGGVDDDFTERLTELIRSEMPSETIIQRCVELALQAGSAPGETPIHPEQWQREACPVCNGRTLYPPGEAETNQCDGCNAGDLPDKNGIHRNRHMACQRDKYATPPSGSVASGAGDAIWVKKEFAGRMDADGNSAWKLVLREVQAVAGSEFDATRGTNIDRVLQTIRALATRPAAMSAAAGEGESC